MTPGAALLAATRELRRHGVVSARADAEALVRHVVPAAAEHVSSEQFRLLTGLVARRVRREPLAHLTGHVVMRGVRLAVGPGVFVPQPESASVVDWIVEHVGDRAGLRIVDLCSGAGTLAFCLAHALGDLEVHAVEVDPVACDWARRNADLRAAMGDARVEVHQADAADAPRLIDGPVDLVVANPPYVADHETHVPAAEVLRHDPPVALWAGPDGLDLVRVVERAACELLRPGGLLVVEHSDRQGSTAPAVLDPRLWAEVQDHRDHEGRDRFVTARRTRDDAPDSREFL